MPKRLTRYLTRHEAAPASLLGGVKSALGGALAMAVLGGMAAATGQPLLLAPFGATAVILFTQPASPLAQPANVLFGYLVAACLCLALGGVLPAGWWAAALGVGLSILVMALLRVTHPPAGALPILLLAGGGDPMPLLKAVGAGSVGLVVLAALFHALPPMATAYPRR
ncbi:MAG TPA: HPP family protein [Azospirillaceae bacterium]|nr:HPP family protein [Azospirillaceae bacterium]